MISGWTDSEIDESIKESKRQAINAVDMNSTIEWLIKRRENVIKGNVNCIPLPFRRFSTQIPGIEQGQYVVVTASTKAGKTQLASYLYLYTPLKFAFEHPDKCRVHIIYFALEESPQRVRERYISHLLNQLDGIRISPADLRSTDSEYPLPEDIIKILETQKYQDRLKFFDDHVQFETENLNPTGIRNVCINYARSVGTVHSHSIRSNANPDTEIEVFDNYEPDDPNLYKIVIVDHMSLIEVERGYTMKNTVDKLSEYFVKYLRNRYNFTCVAIQQQAFENEGLEAIKLKKMKPTLAGLSDTKYTSRDSNLVLGIFSPDKFGLERWMDYDISRLRNNARFVEILANRDGEVGGVCPLLFDGATCNFEEMPSPDNVGMEDIYKEAENRRTYRQQRKLLSLPIIMLNIIF